MAATLFKNVMIFDGTGRDRYSGQVLVDGNRIKRVARERQRLDAPGATVVDGGGATLMPGLINGHFHPSFTDFRSLPSLGEIPPEEHTLITARNCAFMLDHGFTAAVGAASAKPRLDIVIRDAINAGSLPGPRLLAATPEITVTGGLGDERLAHLYRESVGIIADGPDEIRRVVRMMCREGVDIIKINNAGDHGMPNAMPECTVMNDAEVGAAVEVANSRGRRVAAHARAAESIKQCIRFGIDIIYHANLADDEALDLLEANKDRVFVVPAFGLSWTTVNEGEPFGFTAEKVERLGHRRVVDRSIVGLAEMHRRGVKVLPFGDYGIAWTPHGRDARDLQLFVDHLGFTPAEALCAATMHGGELFGRPAPAELGQIRDGYLADLLLVDGNPLADLSLLLDRDRFLAIMKDGVFHKPPRPSRAAAVAAE